MNVGLSSFSQFVARDSTAPPESASESSASVLARPKESSLASPSTISGGATITAGLFLGPETLTPKKATVFQAMKTTAKPAINHNNVAERENRDLVPLRPAVRQVSSQNLHCITGCGKYFFQTLPQRGQV